MSSRLHKNLTLSATGRDRDPDPAYRLADVSLSRYDATGCDRGSDANTIMTGCDRPSNTTTL